MADNTLDIQQLVSASGIPRRTIYFYVQQGLLPPPNGAGLAAFYTDEHLLRLQLIPVMRQQGLRLDEIRERFAKMNPDEMRGILQSAQQQAPAPAAPRSEPAQSLPGLPPTRPAFTPPLGWDAQRYTHYTFPGGISLSVPENLSHVDRQRVEQLLDAARRIFFSFNKMIAYTDPSASTDGPKASTGPEDDDSSSSEPSNGKTSSI